MFVEFVVFTATCAMIHFVVAGALRKFWPRAARVTPSHKVFYVVADVLKGSVLALFLCMPSWHWTVWSALVEDVTWASPVVRYNARWFAVLYGALDASQFCFVKMSKATQRHHLATSVFAVYLSWQPATAPVHPLARALLWYGLCSTVAYLVNVYKALRVVFDVSSMTEACRRVAAGLYALELAVNWPVHTVYIVGAWLSDSVPLILVLGYVGVTLVLMQDDWLLLKFLLTPAVPFCAPKSVTGH